MKFINPTAQLFVPDSTPEPEAFGRVTHLGIGAHQDDLEFMAFHGILAGYHNEDKWFGGVTCTNGSGSARTGAYANHTDEDMQVVRKQEQNTAAEIGQYGVMVQLDYASGTVKNPADPSLETDLMSILKATQPEVVYTHNPADKHDTHLAVFAATMRALRSLPQNERPSQVLGCEVWRGLDWMMDQEKVPLDVGGNDTLADALNGVFASQIAGGKRYDLATMGRRLANATFFESHGVDESNQLWFAMDLTTLVQNDTLDIVEYVDACVNRFAEDVRTRLRSQLGQ